MAKKNLENQILAKLRAPKGQEKRRVTFFISVEAKDALSKWCKRQGVKESPTVEEMIRAIVPQEFFK